MFPDDVLVPRALVNRPGLTFEAGRLSNLYAEDVNDISDHVVAVENYILNYLPPPEYPWRGCMKVEEFDVYAGNALTLSIDNAQWRGGFGYQTSPALNNEIYSTFLCAGGTYEFKVYGIKSNSYGIIDIYIDDTKILENHDLYAAALTRNQNFTIPDIALTPGNHTIRIKCVGKNASAISPYYYFPIGQVTFRLTGE